VENTLAFIFFFCLSFSFYYLVLNERERNARKLQKQKKQKKKRNGKKKATTKKKSTNHNKTLTFILYYTKEGSKQARHACKNIVIIVNVWFSVSFYLLLLLLTWLGLDRLFSLLQSASMGKHSCLASSSLVAKRKQEKKKKRKKEKKENKAICQEDEPQQTYCFIPYTHKKKASKQIIKHNKKKPQKKSIMNF
jgi:hypothetical protein